MLALGTDCSDRGAHELVRRMGAVCHLDPTYGCVDTPGVGSTWTCRTSGVVLASESSAKRMIYDASSDLNGRPGWVGSLADQTGFVEPGTVLGSHLENEAAYTLIITRVVSGVTPSASVLVSAEGSGVISHNINVTEQLVVERYDGSYTSYASNPVTVGPAVDCIVFSGAYRTYSVHSNGAFYGSGSVTQNSHVNLKMKVGTRSDAAFYDLFFEGTIGDIVLFPRALATTERALVESVLMSKYGIA